MAVEFVPPAELIAPNAVAVLPVLLEATPIDTEFTPWLFCAAFCPIATEFCP